MSDGRDRDFMARALALAARGLGGTSPNPMVGAVLVNGGEVVGEGWHARAGGPHAEIVALQAAGAKAQGATLYVTLEPCCHTGRTGPCSQALIDAGVGRVVAARRDPNPRVDGGGFAALRAAGIPCESGLCEAEAAELNRSFETWITTGRPRVILKMATSIDGRIAREPGPGHAVTGPEAHAVVHALRASVDAVAVGSETALTDDPRLTVRGDFPGALPPLRVVFDSRLKVPRRSRLFDDRPGGALAICALPEEHPRVLERRAAGQEVLCAPERHATRPTSGRVDLKVALAGLAARSPAPVTSILVEGGGGLAASLANADLIDTLILHIAPDLYGSWGVSACGPLKDLRRFERASVDVLGRDLAVTYHRARG